MIAVTPLLLFTAGFASWTISTLSGGGGNMFLVPIVAYLVRAEVVAPVVTMASLLASPARLLMLWEHVDWRVVRAYLPGAIAGAILGGWTSTWIGAKWLHIIIAVFLISTAWQYRFGARPRSFNMKLLWFAPVGFVIGLISGLVGASGLLANPFYLNYGLIKEPMIATRAVNSVAIQVAKLGTYTVFGALSYEIFFEGMTAGVGAVAGIWCSNRWLGQLSDRRFRLLAVLVMVTSGVLILWRWV